MSGSVVGGAGVGAGDDFELDHPGLATPTGGEVVDANSVSEPAHPALVALVAPLAADAVGTGAGVESLAPEPPTTPGVSLPPAGRPKPLYDPGPYSTPSVRCPGPLGARAAGSAPGVTSASRAVIGAPTAVPGLTSRRSRTARPRLPAHLRRVSLTLSLPAPLLRLPPALPPTHPRTRHQTPPPHPQPLAPLRPLGAPNPRPLQQAGASTSTSTPDRARICPRTLLTSALALAPARRRRRRSRRGLCRARWARRGRRVGAGREGRHRRRDCRSGASQRGDLAGGRG